MRILVTGLLPHDSGKTWLGLALVQELKDRRRLRVAAFKPVAGHNAWYQFKTVLESLKRGVLVGEDALRYLEVLGSEGVLDLVNPIDMLLAPRSPSACSNVVDYIESLEDQARQLVLARVSRCASGSREHFVFTENLRRAVEPLVLWLEKLAGKLKAREGNVKEFASMLMSRDVEELLDECREMCEERADVLVIESFNDAATPYGSLLGVVDYVVVVMPGKAYLYEGKDFARASEESYQSLGLAGLRVSFVVRRLVPVQEVDLPPVIVPHEEELMRAATEILNYVLRK